MIRLARRASLLVAFYLFTSAGAAYAEGAWALWGQTVDPWNAIVFLPLGTWTSRDECDRERDKRTRAPEELRMSSYVCLPDSVDPRPKQPEK